MEEYEQEQEYTCRPLHKVKPVSAVSVAHHVRLGFGRNNYAVNRMKNERQKDAEYFDKQKKRQVVYVLNLFIEKCCAIHRGCIREHMHEEKQPKRDDARQLMNFTQ